MTTLDRYDITILNELQIDARLSNAELAQRVGLSAAPCWRRVRALEDAGYILAYRAEIDRHKIGLDVALEALRAGWQERRFTIDQLWRYAAICRMTNVMRPYLEGLT